MRMTTKGQYAIIALTHMKKRFDEGETAPIRISEIANREAISPNYLEQLFRKLRVAGLVQSVRGPGGGYVFAREGITEGALTKYMDKEINYAMVLEAVGEKVSFRENISDHSEASNDVIVKLNSVYETLTSAFESMSI